MTGRRLLAHDTLQSLATQVLQKSGANAAAAAETARALVRADTWGLSAHGVSRLPLYAAHLRNGRVNGLAVPTLVKEKGATSRFDAADGLAYPACRLAVEDAMRRATEFGIGLSAVINSNHFGAAAAHLEAVAKRGLVGIAFGNSPAALAAPGGSRPVIGKNPLAAVFPRADADPLLIDLSVAEAGRGELIKAAREGRAIPLHWALDKTGQPTACPTAALQGSIQAAGGAKGTMLALIIELLVGAVVGAAFGFEADCFFNETGNRAQIGQAFLVIDPGALAGCASYYASIEALITQMLADDAVRLPGERRLLNASRAIETGVEIPASLLNQLRALA